MICLMTGQPGAGKTTIAKKMIELSSEEWFLIDGDNIRELFENKDYSKLGREKNIILSYNIATYLESNQKNSIISLISPYKQLREELKNKHNNLLEVYVYTNNIRDREKYFVSDYEKPIDNFLSICTDIKTVDESANEILLKLKEIKNGSNKTL